MSASARPSLSIRALLLMLGLGALAYVGILSVQVAAVLQPTATALEALTRDLLSDHARIASNIQRLRDAQRQVSRLAPPFIEDGTPRVDPAALQVEVRSLLDSGAAVRAAVERANLPLRMRLLLAEASELESATAISLLDALRALDLGNAGNAISALRASGRNADSAVVLLSQAQGVALADLLEGQQSLVARLRSLSGATTAWIIIGLPLLLLAGWVTRRRFYVPVRTMEAAVQRITDGDLSVDVPVRFSDELGRLGEHLNAMTAVLRERAAQETRARENLTERFGRILDESASQIFVFDADSLRIVQANRGARDALGYSSDGLPTLTLPELFVGFPPEQVDDVLRALRGGQTERRLLTTWLRRRDGGVHPAEVTLQHVTDDKTGLFVMVADDAGARQQVRAFDERIREYSLLHQSAVASGDIGAAMPPLAEMVASALDLAHCSVWQGSASALTCVATQDRAHGASEPAAPPVASGTDNQGTLQLPIQVRTRAAGLLAVVPDDVEHRWTPEERTFLATVVDLAQRCFEAAERRALEQALERAQRMDSIGQLAGGVAHDFNNILTAILGNLEASQADLPPDSPSAAAMEEAQQAALRAAGLTKQLLTFARHQVVEIRATDVATGIRGTESMLRRLIGTQCQLTVDIGEDVGSVRLGTGQLDQLLVNLVVNARDAMPEGGSVHIVARRVTLGPDDLTELPGLQGGTYVELQVRDTGTGMDARTLERVFEPFFTTKQLGQGTGLGLAVCYGIAQNAGGHIGVVSAPGKGTTFRILLPATRVSGGKSAVSPPSSVPGREVILLAEDEVAIRTLLSRLLTTRGYRVLAAEDGEAALELLQQHQGPVDLLLTDLSMPRLDGRTLAERLRQRFPELPVLLMSGYSSQLAPQAGLLADARFIAKPFTTDDLLRVVRECLDSATREGATR